MSVIFHLDLDAFFVSVERILNPNLIGKPVIVGGDPHGRGVVAACSYEARAFGLHSAMPIRQAYRLCPGGIYLHGHYDEYVRYSNLVENLLRKYAPIIEKASIDEFYLDFSGCHNLYGNFLDFASRLQSQIYKELKLPCSIGIAGNKTVAKVASDFNKPNGITYLLPGMEKSFLAPLPVESLPGVGKVFLKELHSKGIYRIGDVLKLPVEYYSSAFGKAGLDLWNKAHGKGSEHLTPTTHQKSISKETTFSEDKISIDELFQHLFNLCSKVSQSLRDHKFVASTVQLKLRYSDFETITRARTIPYTNDDAKIYAVAKELLLSAYTRRVAVRLLGIGVTKFAEYAEQQSLFKDIDDKRNDMLKAVTALRNKYGYDVIKIGSFGKQEKPQKK